MQQDASDKAKKSFQASVPLRPGITIQYNWYLSQLDNYSLEHVQIKGLYPCGEGAGYAGGIISAAIDGEKCALKIAESLGK